MPNQEITNATFQAKLGRLMTFLLYLFIYLFTWYVERLDKVDLAIN